VLGQSAEVRIGTWVEVARPLRDPRGDVIVIPGPSEIVDEVGYRFTERNTSRDPICGPSNGHRMPSP
jgi:hypothetical protein